MLDRSAGFVVLVGPDGVGKTSVAVELASDPGTRYFHFRPPVTRPWDVPTAGETMPKTVGDAGLLDGLLRLAVAFVRLWVGHLLRVRPAVARGELVVGDRWAYGYLVRPAELRYRGPEWPVRLFLRALPSPDLVVALSAPPEVIHRRKAELSVEDIARDLAAWQAVPARRLIVIDTLAPPGEIAASIRRELGPPGGTGERG